ncbi:hypothetical protein AB0O18_04910 [Streptomyces sp. NPDC093224]|uniref:hypothetical protein n=1 Tax=Streptomyces sp. NPDC093224 TaxID=3155198 RepID=UPI003424CB42
MTCVLDPKRAACRLRSEEDGTRRTPDLDDCRPNCVNIARTDRDVERDAITAAIQRLLDGRPTRSTGALTTLQLAAEAGVKRWVLTHKHVDLQEEFVRRESEANGIPPAYQHLHARAIDAEAAAQALREDNDRLRERVAVYAQVIHELRTELGRLTNNTQRSPFRGLPISPTSRAYRCTSPACSTR